jgi:hypothetical protein
MQPAYSKEEIKTLLLKHSGKRTYEALDFFGPFELPIHEVLPIALTELIQEGKFVISGHFTWHGEFQPLFERKD